MALGASVARIQVQAWPALMSRGAAAARTALWYSGSIASVQVLQFGFSIASARILAPDAFAPYGIGLVAVGLIGTISSSGLAATVVSRRTLTKSARASFATTSLFVGVIYATAFWLLTPYWAQLWGDPNATDFVRLLTPIVLFTPILGLMIGLARRARRIRSYAVASAIAGAVGVAAALPLLLIFQSDFVLAVQPSIAVLLCVATHRIWLGTWLLPGRLNLGAHTQRLRSMQDVTGQLLDFCLLNIPAWSIGAFLGATSLGFWNRAAVFGQAPFVMLRTAASESILSETTVNTSGPRANAVIRLTLLTSAWAGIALLLLLPIILGDVWVESALLAPALTFAAGCLLAASPLIARLRTSARQRAVIALTAVSALPLVVGVPITALAKSPMPVAVANAMMCALMLGLAARQGLAEPKARKTTMLWIPTVAFCTAAISWGLVDFLYRDWQANGLALALPITGAAVLAFMTFQASRAAASIGVGSMTLRQLAGRWRSNR